LVFFWCDFEARWWRIGDVVFGGVTSARRMGLAALVLEAAGRWPA
jgi:hypothetical protein